MTTDQKIALFGAIAQFATSIAAALVAAIAYFASKRSYETQSRLAMLTTINDFNALALTNDACLKTFHKVLTGEDIQDEELARETWAAYSFLNNRQMHFFLAKTRYTNKAYLEQDKKNLESLLHNKVVRQVLARGGYDPAFLEYCDECIGPPSSS